MFISGRLSEFSLAEVFQLLELGNKTGLLTLRTTDESLSNPVQNHYIWLQKGQIVAAANRLDSQGLLRLIRKQNWFNKEKIAEINPIHSLNQPLGVFLKSKGMIEAEYLKIMFYMQVMQQVCTLFQFQDGNFKFDNDASLPFAEMTGLGAPPTEVTLAGLRVLKNWTALAEKLPDLSSGLISVIQGKPHLNLNQEEWQVWEFVDGKSSLKKAAQQLNMSMERIQQIGFRLIVINLVEEVPLVEMKPPEKVEARGLNLEKERSQNKEISKSFMNNLMGFLKNKI